MTVLRLFVVVLLLCAPAVGQAYAQPAPSEPLRIVTGEWTPYVSADLPQFGPVAEIIRRSFANAGVTVQFVFYPWKRCERLVESGEAFGAFPYVKTPVRSSFADYSDTLFVARSYFFYMKSRFRAFDFINIKELGGFNIGGALGYNYIEPWTEAGLHLTVVPDEAAMFKMLRAGRVDLVPGEEHIGWNLIRRLFPEGINDFVMTRTPYGSENNYLMISKRYPAAEELKRKFNSGLAQLRATGEYQRILAHLDPSN